MRFLCCSLSCVTVYAAPGDGTVYASHALFLHLLLFLIVVALQVLLRELLRLLPDLLGHLLVPSLCWSLEVADPCHLQLKLLVLVVIMRYVDDARCLLDTLLQGQLTFGKVQLLEL